MTNTCAPRMPLSFLMYVIGANHILLVNPPGRDAKMWPPDLAAATLADACDLLLLHAAQGLMEAGELAGLPMPGSPSLLGMAQGMPSVIHISVVGVEGQDVEAQQLISMSFDQARRLWKVGAIPPGAHAASGSLHRGADVC